MKLKQYIVYLPFILIGIYVVIVPAVHVPEFGISGLYNQKRILQLLLYFLLLLLLFIKNIREGILKILYNFSLRARLSFFIVVLLGIFSALFAEFTDWALLEVTHYVTIALLIMIIASASINHKEAAIYFMKFIVISVTGFYLFRFGIGYILHLNGTYPLWPGNFLNVGYFGFSHIRFFNQIQTWTLPLLLILAWQEKEKKWQYLLLTLSALWWMLVFASGGRGTLLSTIVSLLLLVYVLKKQGSGLYKISGGTFVVGALSYLFLFKVFATSNSISIIREGTSGRINVWLDAIQDIVVNPFLGYGPMHFASITLRNPWGHPHNWLLQFSYEWGLPAAFILLGIFLIGLYAFITRIKLQAEKKIFLSKKEKFKIGVFWSMLAAFLHAFLSGIIVMPLSQVWLILIVGTAIALHYDDRKLEPKNIHGLKRKLIVVIILLIFGYLQWFTKHGINQEKYHQQYQENSEINRLYPRFWQQGKIGIDSNDIKEGKIQ